MDDVTPQPTATSLPPRWWVHGQTPRERKTDKPAWADFAEHAVTAPLPRRPPVGDWRVAFAGVFRSFVDAACREAVPGDLADADVDELRADFATQLDQHLLKLSVRTLVLELHRARKAGTLQGETPEERFADFVRQQSTPAGLVRLFSEYPVLARLLAQACRHAAEAHAEMLNRFSADADALPGSVADGELGTLVAVAGGVGDSHARGRSVKLLRFSSGTKVIYKPRPLILHERFTELVERLNKRLPGLELRTADAVPRDGYGWLRFVEHRPCADIADVDRFYRRQGILLALLHALDATDVHYENIIASGDQPVLIDIETLFQPSPADPPDGDPAAAMLARSVQRTLLLPQLFAGEHGAVDISGLAGRGGRLPTDRVEWADPGTDRMRLVRVPGELAGGNNLPRLDGRDVAPAEHSAALLAGFRLGYDAVSTARDELAEHLKRCAEDPIRVLIRPTNFYFRLLDETTHPDLLRDAADRDRAFDLLEEDSAGEEKLLRLVPHERADLWAGDVPMFTSSPGSTSLLDSRGDSVEGVVERPSLDTVLAKVAEMDPLDQRDQEWLISATLAISTAAAGHHGGVETAETAVPNQAPDAERLLVTACGIADHIVANAFSDERRSNWLGIELVDDRYWTVLPMGAGLGEGYCGVALFLAQLAELTGIARYRDLAAYAIAPLPGLFATLRADPDLAATAGCGGLLGLGGVAYTIARLSTLVGLPAGDLIEQAVDLMPEGTPETPSGFTTGLAGGVASMRSVYVQTGLEAALTRADRYTGQLLDRDRPQGTGFAHGSAGVDWVLRAHDRTGEESPERDDDRAEGTGGWCDGLAGAALGLAAHLPDPANALELDRAVKRLSDGAPLKDLSLCHGETGVTEVLCVLAENGHTGAAAAVRRRTGHLLAAIDQRGARCGTPGAVPSPGLLSGLAGIGYGLLRLGFGDRVPSALLLRPDRPHPAATIVPPVTRV
ncbi:type 2 lanthipeptide synthetase LanM family protein [Amycolatopsis regifaucium]|uniref:type 2 lanthipeptide synthetase LanM family protein n=1 Tax=Amycolatopsis regifaucium TaxID=546365 RepID=UPI001FC9D68C|nr:type 2 lanthipeptide synthetase LanM family protein [Amycolatopsis regifaucium]